MEPAPSVIRIALVGGGPFCAELLAKTAAGLGREGIVAPFVAVADPDPESPGMRLAAGMGLSVFGDFRDLYDPRLDIQLIIVLTPEEQVLHEILATRPPRIRILSYPVFQMFWTAIAAEERKLRQRSGEMEAILNGIEDFILVILPDRTIADANLSFLRKMGISREEVIGRRCDEVYRRRGGSCGGPGESCPLERVVRHGRHERQVQRRGLPGGEVRLYEVNVYPVWEKNGRISRFIHISRDITAWRRQEEELTRRLERMVEERTRQLQETTAQLLHRDKMASLGKLAAAVVHEINNPIAGILNLTLLMKRMLAEGPPGPGELEDFRGFLGLMETETRRVSRIVSDLLAFSRQSRLEMKPLDLNRLIEKTVQLNANLLKIAGVQVEKHLAPELFPVFGSEDQLQQVLVNLICNAAQAMEPRGGGRLTLTSENDPGGEWIRIRIEDTGVGIPAENLPRIFEPFFTTRGGKGVGLGLSVAYGIVQGHGGSITVASRVGEGTHFEIRLPRSPDGEPGAPGKEAAWPPPESSSSTTS